MEPTWKDAVWRQFGAASDMLENALLACPDELWRDTSRQPPFWYLVYHTLFWLDLYLADSLDGFSPPAPFTLDELNSERTLPERPYTKAELRSYLEHGRRKCEATIAGLTDARARQRPGFSWIDVSVAELLLYNLRHVQHGAAQLNLILRQITDSAPEWVSRASGPVNSA